MSEPISAIATAPGLGGIAIVRISGDGAHEVAARLIERDPGRDFFYTVLRHPVTHEKLDDAIVLKFRAPHSYTGEDTVELQCHGGSEVSRRVLEATFAAGARLAEPGEFSQRAFLNGRIDLTQAEAVCDIIHAKSERAVRSARAQLDGALGHELNDAFDTLLDISADIEHSLDFDEGELPEDFTGALAARLGVLQGRVAELLRTRREGELLREGALVVISGAPNAGKSSLMNALLRRNRAIVNARPGTTRDSIEESVEIGGIPLRLVDTAGLRESDDEIEREGIDRARELIDRADLVLRLYDVTEGAVAESAGGRALILYTKCDLPHEPIVEQENVLCISSKTGMGLEELRARMLELLGSGMDVQADVTISVRHAQELLLAQGELVSAQERLAEGSEGLVFAASHLKDACDALGRITGRVYTEDLLDRIFSKFCVGK